MNGYNQSPFANITPVVKNLLVINIVVFIGAVSIGRFFPNVMHYLPVYYFNSPNFKLWEIITYMFMHAGLDQPQHILFNMFALFSFGPILEYSLGPRKFLNLYLLCGIGAVVCNQLVQAYEVHAITGAFTISDPASDASYLAYGEVLGAKLWAIYHGSVVGASGAIFGLLVTFGMMFPNMELMMLFIPVPIKAKYIIPGYILLELWLIYKQSPTDNVAHFAHIGGALIGYIMVKIWRLQHN
ncbi:rhomboid family intramembrane serine protease [Mucilaginibacter ginsenosidivorax]|uniref:Rhomboid family intramembrane serine protease n=1 Tax=Mucilaginibacter ginsenosidivorax TaxID=862126 RepID=A0A5B8W2B9_9SPHI|nr:rhomboid family intramembrane serine protease [Mucilaginibacter ginsenosidivorax]QEC77026.1 rhomboid family intramembrane serine protease [Mucilaginibacter ginsenosidivorax]